LVRPDYPDSESVDMAKPPGRVTLVDDGQFYLVPSRFAYGEDAEQDHLHEQIDMATDFTACPVCDADEWHWCLRYPHSSTSTEVGAHAERVAAWILTRGLTDEDK
jgi:hypothetical protein